MIPITIYEAGERKTVYIRDEDWGLPLHQVRLYVSQEIDYIPTLEVRTEEGIIEPTLQVSPPP